MRRRAIGSLLVGPIALMAIGGGCAAPDPAREARQREAAEAAERAASRRYVRPREAVWDALVAAAAERKLSVVRQSRESGELEWRSGLSGLSAGEHVSARLSSEPDGSIRVEIRSRPVIGFSVPVDWQRLLFGDLEQRLAPRRPR